MKIISRKEIKFGGNGHTDCCTVVLSKSKHNIEYSTIFFTNGKMLQTHPSQIVDVDHEYLKKKKQSSTL